MNDGLTMLSEGFDAISNMRLRKKQMEVDAQRREAAAQINARRIKLQEEQAAALAGERSETAKARIMANLNASQDRRERMIAATQAAEAARDPNNPRNQLLASQKAAATAAAELSKQRTKTPYDAQLEAINAFADEMDKAQAEHAAALTAAQAGDPNAARIANKAALRLDGLKKLGANLVKEAKTQPEPVVTVEMDGPVAEATGKPASKVSMKVPQSQWNESHPMFKQFQAAATPAPTPTTASDGIPTLTPEQARAHPEIKKYRTTDGRLLVR